MLLADRDIIRVERIGPGEARGFVHRVGGGGVAGSISLLPDCELLRGAGFDFGGGELRPGCQNLAFSILRACVPADVARQWWQWFSAAVVARAREPRWEITAGAVRDLVRSAQVWWDRETEPVIPETFGVADETIATELPAARLRQAGNETFTIGTMAGTAF